MRSCDAPSTASSRPCAHDPRARKRRGADPRLHARPERHVWLRLSYAGRPGPHTHSSTIAAFTVVVLFLFIIKRQHNLGSGQQTVHARGYNNILRIQCS